MFSTTLGRFRLVAMLEGVSFLILLGVCMPLKYLADMPWPNKVMGWTHGLLFLLYLWTAIQAWQLDKWSVGKFALSIVAALLPFGPFVFDRYVRPTPQ